MDCDVCLANGTCTENFPFYIVSTRECVEICGLNEILDKTCLMNHSNALDIIIRDPFNILNINPKRIIESIQKLIGISIVEKYALQLNINKSTIEENIDKYIGNGKIFNLPNNEIIN